MSLGKKDIAKNISSKAQISLTTSNKILDKFIHLIISESSTKVVKISNFGSFLYLKTPKRIGRNPISMKEYVIPARSKLLLKASNKIKKYLN